MYEERINALAQPSFLKIKQIAVNELSQYTKEERNRFYDKLSRGTALLDSHELMCQYLYSYGNMHKSKIDEALSHMPHQLFDDKTIQIIDWGCGQGLATICFFDYIKENNITCTISKAVLIEPASMTLDRAKLHVEKYIDSKRISALPKYFNDLKDSDIESSADITLHFFSNILDVEAVDIKDLAKRISNVIQGEHYFVCIGPLNSNNRRIDSFYDWFNTPELIWEDQHNKDNHNYTAKYKLFKIERFSNQPVIVPYNPPVQFYAAMVLDGVRNALQDNAEKASALLRHLSAFEVATPFDIGASIYEDVDPLFAVLNNIIVRGLPTKASPFIEKAFCALGNKESESNLGSIDFELPDFSSDEAFLALHTLDNRFLFGKETYNTSILDSSFEQDFTTNPGNHFLSHFLQPQRYLKSITNQGNHYAQRVDFALEFPYSSLSENKGIVIELDGAKYHQGEQIHADEQRDKELQNCKWSCIRIKENNSANDFLKDVKSSYFNLAQEAFKRSYTKEWTRTLQLVFSPIAIARIEKTIIEALLTQKLDIHQEHWNIFVDEKDVPCAVLAFADLQQMFLHISELSEDYADYKLPQINLTVISNKEFVSSPLHKLNESNGINIKVYENTTEAIKAKTYDLVIDIAVMRRSGIEKIDFSDYKCKNECYFNIRSSHYSRTDRYIYTSDVINYKPLVIKDSQGLYLPIAEQEQHLQYFLQMLFRKQAFRPGQLPILSRALQNKSVIGLLPTGGGKSLTYQIAAMLQPGVTIVVDPLTSLMQDQYEGLKKSCIDTCSFINSTTDAVTKEQRVQMMENSQLQFIFLSPERLCIYSFRERLKNMHELGIYFSYGVIDEVHCVSEWGHDFRFSYLHLGKNLYKYVLPKNTNNHKHISLFGLTATASFDVLADVERELSGNNAFPLDNDSTIRYENTNRLELQYDIVEIDGAMCRNQWELFRVKNENLASIITKSTHKLNEIQKKENIERIKKRFIERESITDTNTLTEIEQTDLTTTIADNWIYEEPNKSAAIVFCPHRKGSIGVHSTTNATGVADTLRTKLNTTRISTFIGGDDPEQMKPFINGKTSIMVATKAFGMGIDKPNVRLTFNMNFSSSLEGFVQEAGRAGRDKKMALATILYCKDYNYDLDVVLFFNRNSFISMNFEKRIMYYLLAFTNTEIDGNVLPDGFMQRLLSTNIGDDFDFKISYSEYENGVTVANLNNVLRQKNYPILVFNDNPTTGQVSFSATIEKAIYRMCCVGIIDDFTRDYPNQYFRLVAKRKTNEEYFNCLKYFLLRYYTEERADIEMQKAMSYKGENAMQKCLGFITEFVYDKIAKKRERAIYDMKAFCDQAVNSNKNWLETNEDLKDTIYYYFNSKFAREDYIADNGEEYSLTTDTEHGKKSSFDIVLKYLKITNDEILGTSGSTIDNVKHLQGAVRLIRRSLTDSNPAIDFLNVFCLLYLGVSDNETLITETKESYLSGYICFYESYQDKDEFYSIIKKYKEELIARNISNIYIELIENWNWAAELEIHKNWTIKFKDKYSN